MTNYKPLPAASRPLKDVPESRLNGLARYAEVAQACNIGLKAVARPGEPALHFNHLAWVQHNCVRANTILNANAKLVQAHSKLPIVHKWGGGQVASADGLRFVVPVRSIYSGSNSRYFGKGASLTPP
ncbi:MAG: transposase [Thermaceae bacterium]|nr:transposase [Thermaceae bacterium]